MTAGSRECILCGSAEAGEIFSSERLRLRLVRCDGCGLVFQDPLPAETEDAYYFSPEFADRLRTDLRATTEARAAEKARLMESAGVSAAGTLLDVGCSSGAWLRAARAAGYDPVGVEIGESLAEAAREGGFEVHASTLETAAAGPLAGRRFEVITFWDVLEHVRDPVAMLEAAAGLLAPGGRVAMTFPNVEGLYPRLSHRLIARPTGVWEYPERVHFHDFSPQTARLLAERAGFYVESTRTYATPFDFYRGVTLDLQLGDQGRRGRRIMLAFEALRAVAYPLARLLRQGNAQFLTIRPGATAAR